MSEQFVHLHVHGEHSMLDGHAKIKPLLAEAARLGMPAVALTDHGNMFGAYEMWQRADRTGVKPIIGIEAYVAPDSRYRKEPVRWGRTGLADTAEEGGKDVGGGGKYLHLTMLAQNATGLRNLFKLSSLASLTGFYGKPRLDMELMAEHAEGIIVTTGCPGGGVQTRLRLGQPREAVKYASTLRDIFGASNVFVELMDHGNAIERDARDGLTMVADKLSLPFVVTNDSHYVHEAEAGAHDALLAVGVGKNLDDPQRFRFQGTGYHLRSAADMYGLDGSDAWRDGCRNTLLIAERVSGGAYDAVFNPRDLMPVFPVPDGETQSSWLREEVERHLPDRYPGGAGPAVRDRIDHELAIIEATGFPAYFLVVADICRYARENGIALGPGRGSTTGSMVAYVLGITALDPIEHSLLFERFLNPERVSPPDADLDFDETRRPDMVRYVTEKYGSERVSQILTFNTIKARAGVKDACRILGLPYALGDRINRAMPKPKFGEPVPLSALEDATHERYAEAAEFRALYDSDPDARRVIDTAKGIEGTVRGVGVHAAGVILSAEPLMDVLPVYRRPADEAIIAGFPFTQCEEMGLLKMDFLGLGNLTVISQAVAGVRANHGVDLDLEKLPFDDPATFALLAHGDTLGVFQLDSPQIRQVLRSMKPSQFGDIVAVLALYRPGPIAANAHIHYVERKTGRRPVVPIHPELEEPLRDILTETYGLVVYKEQVMAIARKLAGFTLARADILRRAMGKKKPEVLAAEWDKFSAGMADNGYSEGAAKAIWDVLVPFSQYGFNRAHSAGYAVMSYWTAYLKANYPAEYMAALLTQHGDDKDRLAIYLAECRRMGIGVLPPSVNTSDAGFTAVGKTIHYGLGAIRNIGEAVVGLIAQARKAGPFASFDDFLARVPASVCNKRVIAALIAAGAFDSLGHTRRSLALRQEQAVALAMDEKRRTASGQLDMFGGSPAHRPAAEEAEELPRDILLRQEREMLGRYVSGHPLDGAEPLLERNRTVTVADMLAADQRHGEVRLAGILTAVDRRYTRKDGSPWAIITLEDLTGSIEVMVFPSAFKLYGQQLIEDFVVSVDAHLAERDEAVSVVADSVHPLDAETGSRTITLSVPEANVTGDLVTDLKLLFGTHQGGQPVRLELTRAGGSTLMELPGCSVDGGSGFWADVKALLGTG